MNKTQFIKAVTKELISLGYTANEIKTLLDPETGMGSFANSTWTINPDADFDPHTIEEFDDVIWSIIAGNKIKYVGQGYDNARPGVKSKKRIG